MGGCDGGVTGDVRRRDRSRRARSSAARSLLPANIELPRDLEPAIRRIYDRSPRSGRSANGLRAPDHLRVTIRIDTSFLPAAARSRSCSGTGVEIRAARASAAEQRTTQSSSRTSSSTSSSRLKGSTSKPGARERIRRARGGDQVFETDRAQAAGRVVLAEVRRRPSSPAAD